MKVLDVKIVNERSLNTRSCDGCAKCCEGWLSGEAYGHKFYRGRPCFYLNKTCSIYDVRPEDPCRNFKCEWLSSDTFPHWMKPNLVNMIITRNELNGIPYFNIFEAGSTLDIKTLSWIIEWAVSTNNNIMYIIDGGVNRMGSQEFLELPL